MLRFLTSRLAPLLAIQGILLMGCAKTASKDAASKQLLITKAQSFFENTVSPLAKNPNSLNYRARQPKTIDWQRASAPLTPEGNVVIVPVTYQNKLFVSSINSPDILYSLNDLTFLVINRDPQNQFHASVVTFIPDSSSTSTKQSGFILTEDWQGNSLSQPFRLASKTNLASNSPQANPQKQIDVIQSIQACSEIDGYNYSPDDPNDEYSWSETSCSTYSFAQANIGPAEPPSYIQNLLGRSPYPTFQVAIQPPTNPIASISDYFKCFTNGAYPDHTYSIQVCVDQPDPGTREAWGLTPGGPVGSAQTGNIVNTGHTFLILTENNQGNVITRNVGFYPSGIVTPTAAGASSQGILSNDESQIYNISLTINVTSAQFFSILNYVSLGNNAGFNYNLNTNNCSTFAINAAAAGGIALPSTVGSWPGGGGNDPGDLGEDIVTMNLPANMTKNTVENPHPNTGSCN